jgi:phage terminase large subunit-like protein
VVAAIAANAESEIDHTLDGRALQDALRRATAYRRGSCSWDADHAGWVVTLHSPEEQTFYGKTLEEALAWCLVWLMAPELGIGPFRV